MKKTYKPIRWGSERGLFKRPDVNKGSLTYIFFLFIFPKTEIVSMCSTKHHVRIFTPILSVSECGLFLKLVNEVNIELDKRQ